MGWWRENLMVDGDFKPHIHISETILFTHFKTSAQHLSLNPFDFRSHQWTWSCMFNSSHFSPKTTELSVYSHFAFTLIACMWVNTGRSDWGKRQKTQFLSYFHSIMWKPRQRCLASDTTSVVIGEEKGPIKYLGGRAHCAGAAGDWLQQVKPGLCRACRGRRGERAGAAAAVLWSAGNGSGTASASATVTASSCAECPVGDGNLPSLACCPPAGALLGMGKGCWCQGVFVWRWSVPPSCCAGKPLTVLAHWWIVGL